MSMAQEVLHGRNLPAQHSVLNMEHTPSAFAKDAGDLSATLREIAQISIKSALEFAGDAATARTPGDVAAVWTTHIRKQLELLQAQIDKLSALEQKLASRAPPSTAPEG